MLQGPASDMDDKEGNSNIEATSTRMRVVIVRTRVVVTIRKRRLGNLIFDALL